MSDGLTQIALEESCSTRSRIEDDRPAIIPSRDDCEALLDAICIALGCIEPGRGSAEYAEAKRAIQSLRDILNLDD